MLNGKKQLNKMSTFLQFSTGIAAGGLVGYAAVQEVAVALRETKYALRSISGGDTHWRPYADEYFSLKQLPTAQRWNQMLLKLHKNVFRSTDGALGEPNETKAK